MPANVAWFERLMYLAVAIGLADSALHWHQDVAVARPVGGAAFVIVDQAVSAAILVWLIWLTARRHRNWARWVLLVLTALGVIFYLLSLHEVMRIAPLTGALGLVQCAAEIAALVLIFTGNAREWFAPPAGTQ